LLRLGYKRRDFPCVVPNQSTNQTTRPFWARLALSLSLFPFAARSQTSVDEIMICKVMIEENGQAARVPMQLWNSSDSRQPSTNLYIRISLKISKAFAPFASK
jgi:hypothetical protein